MLRLADYQLRARTGARVSLKSSRCLPYPARVVRSREDPGDGSAGTDGHRRAIGHLPLALREIGRSIRHFAQRRCMVRPPRLNANCTSTGGSSTSNARACAAASRSAAMAAMPSALDKAARSGASGTSHPCCRERAAGMSPAGSVRQTRACPPPFRQNWRTCSAATPDASTARNAASNSLPLRRKNCRSSGPLANAPIKPAVPVAAAGIGGRGGGPFLDGHGQKRQGLSPFLLGSLVARFPVCHAPCIP